jgi:hypothetical protein
VNSLPGGKPQEECGPNPERNSQGSWLQRTEVESGSLKERNNFLEGY